MNTVEMARQAAGDVPEDVNETGDAGGHSPVFQGFATRFMFPFLFSPDAVQAAAKALCETQVVGFDEPWQVSRPPSAYRDELLAHVDAYMFPEDGQGGCAYLRLADRVVDRIFRGTHATLRGRTRIAVDIARPAGCEVFLTDRGVGLLSIALKPRGDEIDSRTAIDFNYLGADRHHGSRLVFEIPHPSSDPKRWASIPEEARRFHPPAPPEGAPLDKRLAAEGGVFTLRELAVSLIAPLATVGLGSLGLREKVASAFVFTVARLKDPADFGDPASHSRLAPLLVLLAQVEEPSHPGIVSAEGAVPTARLNRKHWTATSQLGSAHLIADQLPDGAGKKNAFNEERPRRAFTKYFVAYLMGALQTLFLQRSMLDTAKVVGRGNIDKASMELGRLRLAVLEFAVRGYFMQISTRHAVQRYYETTHEALGVPELWQDLRRAIADLDAAHSAGNQQQLMTDMAENVASSVRLQQMVHKSLSAGERMQKTMDTIEIFLVSVYSAELVALLLETLHPLATKSEWLQEVLHWGTPFAVAGAAVVGYVVTKNYFIASTKKSAGDEA